MLINSAASVNSSSPLFTRASTPARCNSRLLIAVLPTRPPTEGHCQGTLLSRAQGDIIKVAQHHNLDDGVAADFSARLLPAVQYRGRDLVPVASGMPGDI